MLNACYSEVQADAIVQHINYAIGMRQEILDDSAIAFSIGFYQGLGLGQSIEVAFQAGCDAIKKDISKFPVSERKLGSVGFSDRTETMLLSDYLIPVLKKQILV